MVTVLVTVTDGSQSTARYIRPWAREGLAFQLLGMFAEYPFGFLTYQIHRVVQCPVPWLSRRPPGFLAQPHDRIVLLH